MAIQMRRGQLADFNPAKMLPGEWAVSTDVDTGDQHVYMCFQAGVVKRMATHEDFESEMEAMSDAIKSATTATAGANDAITKANNLVANIVGIDDTAISLTKTWSSSYINDSLNNKLGNTSQWAQAWLITNVVGAYVTLADGTEIDVAVSSTRGTYRLDIMASSTVANDQASSYLVNVGTSAAVLTKIYEGTAARAPRLSIVGGKLWCVFNSVTAEVTARCLVTKMW